MQQNLQTAWQINRESDKMKKPITKSQEEDFEKKYPHIYKRYKRKVVAHPEGAIVHDGDCRIYSVIRICSCGLHHDLQIYPNEAGEIYPRYWEELKGIDDMEQLARTHCQGDS